MLMLGSRWVPGAICYWLHHSARWQFGPQHQGHLGRRSLGERCNEHRDSHSYIRQLPMPAGRLDLRIAGLTQRFGRQGSCD